jgi:hypothetical protein
MEKIAEQEARSKAIQTPIVRREYWRGQVEQWRDSGLTQKEYCNREGISLERLGTWKRRLDREGQEQTGALVAVPSKTVSSALSTPGTMLRLVVNERFRVEIPDAFSPVTLQTVLHVLDRL